MPLPQLEALVADVLAHREGAWQSFWRVAEPHLYMILRRPRVLGRLSQNEDHIRNIVVDVLAALQADDHARLRRYVLAKQANPELPFWAWLAVVAKRMAIDYIRRQDEFVDLRKQGGDATGAWRELTSLPSTSRLGAARPPVTDTRAAHEVLEFAEQHLDVAKRRALAGWMQGASFEDIAGQMGLGAPIEAERLVRAALERIRRQFRQGDDE
jgi:hypothetical protein